MNSVITGVRFNKMRDTIFLQIQTGKLLALGVIDSTTVGWQELPSFTRSNTVEFNYHDHTMILPDLTFPKKYVLTGI